MSTLEQETTTAPKTTAMTKVAVAMSALALVVSSIALVTAMQTGQADRENIENRLQCLELPGPNDCGTDAE